MSQTSSSVSITTGHGISSRSTARRTLSSSRAGGNPPVCTPIDPQAGVGVALVPGLQVRQRAQRVDAAEVPELDQHGLPALLVHAQRGHVDPRQLARERRSGDAGLSARIEPRR